MTSLATLREGTAHRLIATGVLNVNLQTGDAPKWSRRSPGRRFVSYLTFGAGIVSTTGEEATATLVGRYRYASPAGGPFEETDTVSVRSSGTLGTAFVTGSKVGAIQFVNNSSGRYAGDPSSLSGPPIAGLETFTGTGMLAQINIALGVFVRF